MNTCLRMAVLLAALASISGCVHWSGVKQTTVSAAEPGNAVPESRENLLLSLRHNRHYGLIPYGSQTVLYRDLTKPFPNNRTVAGNEDESDVTKQAHLAMTEPVERESVFSQADTVSGEWTEQSSFNEVNAVNDEQTMAGTVLMPMDPELSVTSETESSKDVTLTHNGDVLEPGQVVQAGCRGRIGYVRNADEDWLADRDPHRWTIQIVSTEDASEPCIDDEFLQELKAPEARRFSVFFNNGLWNVAVTGDYATVEEAMEASKRFESPWIRRIGQLRERRCNSVAFMPDILKSTLNRWCASGVDVSQATLASVERDNSTQQVKPISPFQQ